MPRAARHDKQGSGEAGHCIACREVIASGARICPHCRSSQTPGRWKAVASILKWIGGVTAVLSLAFGVKQMGDIVKEWRDREKAVAEFVAAAEMQSELRDYEAAWRLLERGFDLSPASAVLLQQQVDLSMAWLRDIWLQKGMKTYGEVVDPLLPTLHRGAVARKGARAADVIAHIGWANHLRLRDSKVWYEVDAHFRRALEIDPRNGYAHVFWGYWVLHDRNEQQYREGNLRKALGHFSAALETGDRRGFVNEWSFRALAASDVEGADVEAMAEADALRREGGELERPIRSKILERFDGVDSVQFEPGGFLDRLFPRLGPNDLLETFHWLSRGVDFTDTRQQPFGMPPENHEFMIALLTEATGDRDAALARFKGLERELPATSRLRAPLSAAISRIQAENEGR